MAGLSTLLQDCPWPSWRQSLFEILRNDLWLTLTLPAPPREFHALGWLAAITLVGQSRNGMVVDGLPFPGEESHVASIVGGRSQLLPLLMRQ